ncbi:hypothetical protein [Roseomonas sp. CECT 9278]|uniref:hypothetical protein n=1 Tax=Roseomonas sp. CECT 9278 TaxID=2845823 RepID=UPI001E35D312|nr:hypothetical protein [Roseomonas sp. CECT 9278]CAH0288170.1 hypothetical protein ROS9278_04148 [Roseomonas sp. CECT 9278]
MNRAALLALLALLGCSARDSQRAEDGREQLVGLRADDLRLCAGVPNLTATSAGGDFWTYDRSPPASGVSAPVPVIGGSLSVSAGSTCRVTFQLVDQRVTRVGYAAASDLPLSQNAACAPVVQGCLRLVQEGAVRRE